MAWSPYKSSIIAYVKDHPNCSKMDVARYITHSRDPSRQYPIVNTAIRNGWIKSERANGRYRLSIPNDTSESPPLADTTD